MNAMCLLTVRLTINTSPYFMESFSLFMTWDLGRGVLRTLAMRGKPALARFRTSSRAASTAFTIYRAQNSIKTVDSHDLTCLWNWVSTWAVSATEKENCKEKCF